MDAQLVLGSPIKDHPVTAMLGPAAARTATASGLTLASGSSAVSTGTHLAAGTGMTKTFFAGSVLGSVLYIGAATAACYFGYRAAKAPGRE